jgi:predicted permease
MLPRPIIGLLALTVGLPLLLLIAVVASNPSVSASIVNHIVGGGIMAVFLFLMVGEIKRMADVPAHSPDKHQP